MKEITFDIETSPSVDPAVHAYIAANITPPAQMKKAETIAAWEANEKPAAIHEAILKTAIDGALGSIAVIGVAIDDHQPIGLWEDSTEPHLHERKVITNFFDYLTSHYDPTREAIPKFVGHNITGFDLRFLFQRCVVLGIKPPSFMPFFAKPWDDAVYDTMVRWAGPHNYVKMDKLARVLGLPGKTGMDGSQVWPAIAAGKINEVADYCVNTDVAQTRDIYRRMLFLDLPSAVDADPFPAAA